MKNADELIYEEGTDAKCHVTQRKISESLSTNEYAIFSSVITIK